MFPKSTSLARKPQRRPQPISYMNHNFSRELLLDEEIVDDDDGSYNGDMTDIAYEERELPKCVKRSEEILKFRVQNGSICRKFPVMETHQLIRSECENGGKMINEYVRQYKIGAGSYGKVVLYQSFVDGKQYAIKAFHKAHLVKQRVAPSETAMNDVLREVMIMNMLEHPNIVNLIEVIDDPDADHFYMVLEYVDGKRAWEGSGPPGGIGESTARRYLRDIVSGLTYLHAHNVVHLDIKPDNLLVTHAGVVKIGDFSVSQIFEVPYYSVLVAYARIQRFPPSLSTCGFELKYLCADPTRRMTLDDVGKHAWVTPEDGPIPLYLCWCKRNESLREGKVEENKENGHPTSSESDGIEDNVHVKATD